MFSCVGMAEAHQSIGLNKLEILTFFFTANLIKMTNIMIELHFICWMLSISINKIGFSYCWEVSLEKGKCFFSGCSVIFKMKDEVSSGTCCLSVLLGVLSLCKLSLATISNLQYSPGQVWVPLVSVHHLWVILLFAEVKNFVLFDSCMWGWSRFPSCRAPSQ